MNKRFGLNPSSINYARKFHQTKSNFVLAQSNLLFSVTVFFFSFSLSCKNQPKVDINPSVIIPKDTVSKGTAINPLEITIADAAIILSRKQVPILCYHQIRDYRPTDSKTARDYIVPPAVFQEQMKILADSSYHTILPDELYNYLSSGTQLPVHSILLSFDDSDLEQFTVAAPIMKKYGFKGQFFIMTVSLGRPHYMSKEQVKQLSEDGHVISSHTWDHHNVKKYSGEDWAIQIDKPSKLLAEITGKPIQYFAYPFGLWNKEAIPELKKRGFIAAFQLSAKRDEADPLFTIRRIIVPGSMSGPEMMSRIKASF